VSGGSVKMARGYLNLFEAGYGKNPDLAVSVNSVLGKEIVTKKGVINTLDTMIDLHWWVKANGMEHSIVPIHYCGEVLDENQNVGITPLDVKALYDILCMIDRLVFEDNWEVYSAFPKNKTCNRPGRGVHVRATGEVTSCSESPKIDPYVFGNVNEMRLLDMIRSRKFQAFREEFHERKGKYICNPDACDLNANYLCRGGCATRAAYSKVDPETGLVVRNVDMTAYSKGREDPLCPGWIVLAQREGVLKEGVYEAVVDELIAKSTRLQEKPELAREIRETLVGKFSALRDTL
jgi:radical SAM protein with 4Fe4S-binding SPASM domain